MQLDAGDILATRCEIVVSDDVWHKTVAQMDFEGTSARMFSREVLWLKDVPDHHIGMYAAPLDEREWSCRRSRWAAALERQSRSADQQPDFSQAAERFDFCGKAACQSGIQGDSSA